MHAIDRGPEPKKLSEIRLRFGPRWVRYYRSGVGQKPTDSHWRKFADELGARFSEVASQGWWKFGEEA